MASGLFFAFCCVFLRGYVASPLAEEMIPYTLGDTPILADIEDPVIPHVFKDQTVLFGTDTPVEEGAEVDPEGAEKYPETKPIPKGPETPTDNSCNCGRPYSEKIVGGKPGDYNRMSWMVRLVNKVHNKVYCGGSIIDERHILTAAHCVDFMDPNNIEVKLGSRKLKGGTSFAVRNVTVHKKYSSYFRYDIAIVELENPIDSTLPARPVCIPEKGNNETYAGMTGRIAGWGVKAFSNDTLADELMEADVKMITNTECVQNNAYEKSDINKDVICASFPATDACQGDSGGPLMVQDGESFVIIGIVSWGVGCADPRFPGVYTRVTSFSKWIRKRVPRARSCKRSKEQETERDSSVTSLPKIIETVTNPADERSDDTPDDSSDESERVHSPCEADELSSTASEREVESSS